MRGITHLGNYAFNNCENLKRIIIPKSVRKIGNSCFKNCTNLEEVILQEGLKTIGDKCFWNCENLKKIIIPSSVDSLGFECFGECLNLKIIGLPINYSDVPSHVFNNCYHIEKVNYQSLNLEFLQTIEEILKKEERTKKDKIVNKEVLEKMFYFGKCKLLGIDYKKEYEEFIEYYINNYTIPNKDIVSLDKKDYLKKKEETKLIP
ncbi:MAG: leucine-rich repeat domain-containing protein [Bacilli bacterium]|nr:leucine-rich repeat domain-containing protein [Bacilli bacterium]